ncbi:hypothetical protein UFOVP845_34 [uncultured Caudovirales phage]|jgi:hypothetical protein|uniref:Uncharacterized protein n=1 Tax=uncultured Caudovirales phage TaxID=2100421 RepID=A0A6J5P3W2_9CAUD|nr:hypothetical protein UFOVP845_34 [uncultured Caudovirales phage]
MTIKSNGGVFGRNPTFNNVGIDGTLTAGQNIVMADGKGIDFSATPGTGTSELFDDYEEGTWSPVVWDALTGGNACGMTVGSVTFGSYTKIGRIVSLQGSFRISSVSGVTTSNIAWIRGLPFAPAADQNTYTGGNVSRISFVDTPAGCINLGIAVRTDGNMSVTTGFDSLTAGALSIAQIQSVNANHFLAFNVTYAV